MSGNKEREADYPYCGCAHPRKFKFWTGRDLREDVVCYVNSSEFITSTRDIKQVNMADGDYKKYSTSEELIAEITHFVCNKCYGSRPKNGRFGEQFIRYIRFHWNGRSSGR